MSNEKNALMHGVSAPTLTGTATAWLPIRVNANGGLFAVPTGATGSTGNFVASNAGSITPSSTLFGLQTASIMYAWDEDRNNNARVDAIDVTSQPSFDDSNIRESVFTASNHYVLDITTGDPIWWNPFGCVPGDDFQNITRVVEANCALEYRKDFTGNAMVVARDLGNDIALNNQGEVTTGLGGAVSYGALWGGQSWTRMRWANTTTMIGTTNGNVNGILAAQPVGEWSLTHAPAANTVATVTQAAGSATQVHILRSITASITAVAAIAAPLTVVVRNGAAGAGTIIWQDRLVAPIGTDNRISITGLNIVGSGATAMTVEFTAAPGATNFETVSITGWTTDTV